MVATDLLAKEVAQTAEIVVQLQMRPAPIEQLVHADGFIATPETYFRQKTVFGSSPWSILLKDFHTMPFKFFNMSACKLNRLGPNQVRARLVAQYCGKDRRAFIRKCDEATVKSSVPEC
ncbi:hypothetical protein BBF93_06590 [Hyphomonas sp. CACIAM 19H1]|nr:hypothetical protein BBF93_06590 [Hyphomonas sp. CACIAM 19H1]